MQEQRADDAVVGNEEGVGPEEERRASRRGFLWRSAAAASGLVLAGASAARAKGPTPKRSNLGGGTATAGGTVTAERTSGVIQRGREPDLYPGWNSRNFNEIRADEDAHVAFLIKALGAAARPKPTFQNLDNLPYGEFIYLSTVFENTGVHAYLGALPYISSPSLAGTAATIATVEARHAGYLNTLTNQSIVPMAAPFDTPYTQAQVINAVFPFLKSLNGGPLPEFSTDPAQINAQNDIAILNFALLLEFLEMEFYDSNVPLYYP